jgi:predicted nucleic acid-binding protein
MLAMDVDERDDGFDDEHDTIHGAAAEDEEPQPLARVRYGLGKELLLFPDALVVHLREEREETRYHLASMRRLILMPGEHNPAKLVLMVELDDGTTVIAAEGVSNVRGFRVLLARLREIAPAIELDPEDMDEQLAQALDIRKRYSLGCYGAVLGSCLLLWIVYLVVAFIGAHGPR